MISISEGITINIMEMIRVVFVDIFLVLRLEYKTMVIRYTKGIDFLLYTGILWETTIKKIPISNVYL